MGACITAYRNNYSTLNFNKDQTEVEVTRPAEQLNTQPLDPEHYNHARILYEYTISHATPNRPCIGYLNPTGTAYNYITYATLHQMVTSLARGIMKLALPVAKDDQGKDIIVVGVMSLTRYEWFILTLATWHLNITLVPLYTTLGVEAIMHIFKETEMTLAFVTSAQKEMVATLATKCKCKLTTIVCFEDGTPEIGGFKSYSFNQLLKDGAGSDAPFPLPNKDCIAEICYTSGTTGVPKGVVTTHSMITKYCVAPLNLKSYFTNYRQKRYFSCLPMAHAYESNIQIYLFFDQALIGFSSGNVKKLLDEIKLFKPEVTSLVPKILSRIVASVELKMSELTGIKKRLANRAIKIKLENFKKGNSNVSHMLYDRLIFNKIKALVGGKLERIFSGSAPQTQTTLEKFQIFLSTIVTQGYGLTETLGAAVATEDHLKGVGTGVPLPTTNYKLFDVPDLNYFVNNKDNHGNPVPQGMVCIKGETVVPRYYKNETLTKEAFKDGWFITGDVGKINEYGCLQIIDRVKSLIKLQQGEYISPEKLEGIYGKSLFIANIFIYGDPEKSDLVAIVSLEGEALKKWALKQGVPSEKLTEEFLNASVKMLIAGEMRALAKEQCLNRWEFPRNLYITRKEFSIENNVITPTLKLKRRESAVFFKEEITKCYEMSYLFPMEN